MRFRNLDHLFWGLLAAAFFVAALVIAGGLEYHDERAQFARYCDMVAAGAWPDYRDLYHPHCEEQQP